ncbi:MAG: M20/M25/M40 family metallo-hydrolase [Marinilabiliales bacterium]|nr:M20/M25/M40 family metallo-hydrolase [Marinilabiliales bacterium]
MQLELKRQMEEAGFDEVFIDGMGNVIGRIGSGKKILAIDGHMDTVDLGNSRNWSFDPLGGEIKDGFVHGRGSVDQKGGPAAFVTAGRILKELGFDKDITVYFVGSVMEEDCDGLCWKYIIEEDKIRSRRWLIHHRTHQPESLPRPEGQDGDAGSFLRKVIARLGPGTRGERHLYGLKGGAGDRRS